MRALPSAGMDSDSVANCRSPKGMPSDFGASSLKDHHPAEALPLTTIFRKLLCMRSKLCLRRALSSLRTRQGRQRACLGLLAAAFLIFMCLSVHHLPDTDDEARHYRRRGPEAPLASLDSRGRALGSAHAGDAGRNRAGGASNGGGLDAALGDAAEEASPPPPPGGAAGGSAEYEKELKRRAVELNREITRFKARESAGSKAQRLRQTAEQLDKELGELQKVRQSSFSLKGGQQQEAPKAQAGQRAPQQKQQQQAQAQQQQQQQQAQQQQAQRPAGQAPQATWGDDAGGGRRGAVAAPRAGGRIGGGGRPARREGARAAAVAAVCEPHPTYRVAMLMPWVTEPGATSTFPPWLPYFVQSAAHSAMLVDWLMFHEGPLPAGELPPAVRTPNVKFVDVGVGGIAELLGRGMARKLELPSPNETAIVARMKYMLSRWPRLVAEYKPAYGTAFEPFLDNYTHWGYSDFDVLLGHVPSFIELSELKDHHVVSYSFGDQEALYLRGQWTMHRNHASVNSIWLNCEHLGHGLQKELALKVQWARRNEAAGVTHYHKRFNSAEGAYSHRVLHTKGIKVKIAKKQFSGLELTTHAHNEVYVVNGALWYCDSDGTHPPPSLEALRAASALSCDQTLPGVYTPTGTPSKFGVGTEGCASWLPEEFRICALSLKDMAEQTVTLANGEFRGQPYELAPRVLSERGRCRQGALFHMQEWKKRWEDGKQHISPYAAYDEFKLTQDGIEPL